MKTSWPMRVPTSIPRSHDEHWIVHRGRISGIFDCACPIPRTCPSTRWSFRGGGKKSELQRIWKEIESRGEEEVEQWLYGVEIEGEWANLA